TFALDRMTLDAALSADAKTIATADSAANLRIWDSRTGGCLLSLNSAAKSAATALVYLKNSHALATGGMDGHIRVYSLDDGKLLKEYAAHSARVNSISLSFDGKRIASS